MNPLKWLINLFPPEADDSAGMGPFRLPSPRCDWMQRAARLHDYEFENASANGKRLSEVDADLFWRWAIEAHAQVDTMKRCQMYGDICRYWPIARAVGRYAWDSPELKKPNNLS
jgi:hypothetical protein